MARKSKYTKPQVQVYHIGMGYAVRHSDRNINFKGGKDGATYNSFMAGFRKGNEMMNKSPCEIS